MAEEEGCTAEKLIRELDEAKTVSDIQLVHHKAQALAAIQRLE